MVMVTTKVFPYVFITLILAAIVGIVLSYKFIILLKENHFEKWKELGSPALFSNNSIKNNIAVFKFLKNKEYLKFDNPQLIKTAQILWYYNIFYIIFFGGIAVLFIFNLVISHRQ